MNYTNQYYDINPGGDKEITITDIYKKSKWKSIVFFVLLFCFIVWGYFYTSVFLTYVPIHP